MLIVNTIDVSGLVDMSLPAAATLDVNEIDNKTDQGGSF